MDENSFSAEGRGNLEKQNLSFTDLSSFIILGLDLRDIYFIFNQ